MDNIKKRFVPSEINEYQYMLLTLFDVDADKIRYLTTPTKNFSTLSIWKKMTETQFNCLYYLLHGLDMPFSQRYSIFIHNVVIYNNKLTKYKKKGRRLEAYQKSKNIKTGRNKNGNHN
jgi:hypothetical protein